jgi:hypothetical protein
MHDDKITISTAQLFAMFPDQETARTYLEGRLWPKGPRCPICGLTDRTKKAKKRARKRRAQCKSSI